MGRGPAPKPKAALKAAGSWRAKNRADDIKPDPGAPSPPASLDKEARAAWDRIVPELAEKGVLTKNNRDALVGLCQSWSDYERYRLAAKDHNVVSKEHKHLMELANSAYYRWRQTAKSFGLTPEDRSRVKVDTKKSADDKSHYFKPRIKSG